ncbi:semaphorin-7A [Carettochelys insculpta]|uniref:semaphorin-7A n=1 Tax=Carettochelys insculpta TaxID=44489 RepID=UPI003EBA7A4E
MGLNSHTAYLMALWTSQLLLLTAGHSRLNPRIIAALKGGSRFQLDKEENLTTLYHDEGSSSLLVGAEAKLYSFDFDRLSRHTEDFPKQNSTICQKPEENKNYLTFIGKYKDQLLVCGTNACKPTCWNRPPRNNTPMSAKGLAPFAPNQNSLVLVDGDDIYSTISSHLHNGKIPRFRQVQGSGELYTSDTAMQNPEFVKATVIQRDERYDDKIYYFFREDNPDKSPEAPLKLPRVAQLCKGDKGGPSSLSASKWTTFLKATLACTNPDRGTFNRLQDVFIVPSDKGWRNTRAYGLFSNSWGYSAVCVYTFGDIDAVFRTSNLKGYTEEMPEIRPGQCRPDSQTPAEIFKIADSHPEVEDRVQPSAPRNTTLFYNKNHYRKIGVHRIRARDGHTYNVFYLVTDKGYIHKMVELPHGVVNILEVQPFEKPAPVLAMTLDHTQAKLYVSSAKEVVQVPMDMCEVYNRSCESCVLAKDPYCGWVDGNCISVKANVTMIQNMTLDPSPEICSHSGSKRVAADSPESYQNVTVALFSRCFLHCPVDSHNATYVWHHNGSRIQTCSAAHQPCTHFLENVTHSLYGHYTCVSREGGIAQTLLRVWLKTPESPTQPLMQKSQAVAASLSFWLGFLQMVALVLLFQ